MRNARRLSNALLVRCVARGRPPRPGCTAPLSTLSKLSLGPRPGVHEEIAGAIARNPGINVSTIPGVHAESGLARGCVARGELFDRFGRHAQSAQAESERMFANFVAVPMTCCPLPPTARRP